MGIRKYLLKCKLMAFSKYSSISLISISIILAYFRIDLVFPCLFLATIFALPFTLERLFFLLRHFWQLKFFKICITIASSFLTLIASSFSLANARQIVHSIMLIDPSYFPCSLIVISACLLFQAWLLILSNILLMAYFILMFYDHISKRLKILNKWLPQFLGDTSEFFCFFTGYLGIIIFTIYADSAIVTRLITSDYVIFSKMIKNLIVKLDYYDYSECSNVYPGQYFTYISDNKISIAKYDDSRNDYLFSTNKCIK